MLSIIITQAVSPYDRSHGRTVRYIKHKNALSQSYAEMRSAMRT